MIDSLKALRSPEALKRPWDLQLPIPSLVQRSTQKKVPIVTENASKARRQSLITPKTYASEDGEEIIPLQNLNLKINKVETLMETTTKVKTNNN
ncbi:hypothetical protein AVEN_170135-1 [Araneus ventricosus]|uniref:Uncharacterized protein n=1 Tax=Araneus ventricosus TaxID=182803 RepID=A0A4Y2M6L1_ARAVE|nr:hypothetical protein AVEN_170135-1 [Araneus ventricosus]